MYLKKRCKKIITAGICAYMSVALLCTGCSSKNAEVTSQEEVTSEEEEEVLYATESEDANLGKWCRAMGAVLIYMNEGNPYYFGGYQITDANAEAAKSILQSSWNINNRLELISEIKELLESGARKEYLKERKEMKKMSKKELKTAMKQLSGDLLIHYELVQYNSETWGKKGLLAWDMCRISHLVQWGYIAEYFSLEEAQAMIEPAVIKLKENFSSWEEVQNNWLDGYAFYATIDVKEADTDYTARKEIYEQLVSEQEQNGTLFEDELFTSDIAVLEGYSYKTLFEELEQAQKEQKKKETAKNKKQKEKQNEKEKETEEDK